MKLTASRLRHTLPLLLAVLLLLSLTACITDMDVGNNTELGQQFVDHVIANDYDAAYSMVKATVTDPDFRAYWKTVQAAADGAETYEMEQIGWKINSTNGVTTRITAYQVYLDNDRTVLLRVMTQDGIEGIAGIHFSDITDFLNQTNAFIPTVRIILWVVFGLVVAFTVWMFVDCLRRKMKYKVLWAIIILMSIALTFTVGEASSFSFHVGLFLQPSSIEADPGIPAVITTIVIPVGAILYLCLRKKFTAEPAAPLPESPAEPAYSSDPAPDGSSPAFTVSPSQAEDENNP